VNEKIIVIEQRLRTSGLVLAIAAVLVVFVGASIAVASSNGSHSLPVTGIIVEMIVLVALVFALLMFVRIVVRVVETRDGRALEIVYGPGGVVRQIFGPDKLLSASAQNFSFMQMGGWGYRGSLKFLHRAALVTRRGNALEIRLRGNRRFIVTVEAPQDFVTALAITAP